MVHMLLLDSVREHKFKKIFEHALTVFATRSRSCVATSSKKSQQNGRATARAT